MFSTFVFSVLFLGFLLTNAVVWGLFLWLGLRWASVSNVTLGRIVVSTAIVTTVQIAASILILMMLPSAYSESFVGMLVQLLLAIFFQFAIIQTVFKVGIQQTAQAWLLTLLASVAVVIFAVLIIRPLLYDAFVLPTNAMAPTLVGVHVESVCPECKRPSYGTPLDDRIGSLVAPRMICEKFHVGPASIVEKHVHEGDRILVGKFLAPRRWDIIAFHYPAKPNILDAKRIVGLPGETVQIREGAVWINDQKLIPPAHLAEIKYLEGVPELPQISIWGSTNRPAVLGYDEYFVLGDFSAQSMDSRFWESGAAKHNAFAVPETHIIGVVTHTFWPFSRFRIHR